MAGYITDRLAMRWVKETTFGAVPSGPPTLQSLRFRGESLAEEQDSADSGELRDDGQVTEAVRVNRRANGTIETALSYGTYDDWMAFALRTSTTWNVAVTVSSESCSIATGSGNYTVTAASGTPFSGMTAGRWVKISNASDAANNGYGLIKSIGGSGASLVITGNADGANEGPTSIDVVQGAYIENGTTESSFLIEKEFTDASSFEGAHFPGCEINGLTIPIEAGRIIFPSWDIMAVKENNITATVGDGSPTAANSNDVMAGAEDVVNISEGPSTGDMAVISATQVRFTINNGIRERQVLGTLGPESFGLGKFSVEVGLRMFLAEQTYIAKYLNNTASSIASVAEDDSGNAYMFHVMNGKYIDGKRVGGGENQDILADLMFRGFKRNTTPEKTMQIAKW